MIGSLIAATVALIATPSHGGSYVGTYRLRLSPDAQSVLKALGKPVPTATLKLTEDQSFILAKQDEEGLSRRVGTYTTDGDDVVLHFANLNRDLRGTRSGHRISIDGLAYEAIPVGVVGMWSVWRNGLEDRTCCLSFDDKGNFDFKGQGATSRGSYEIVGSSLILNWTIIDGESVEPGTVRKQIPISEDGTYFMIDTYRYEPASH